MNHDHPGPGARGSTAAVPPDECPAQGQLGLLVQGLLSGEEREALERHVAVCKTCGVTVTRIVDEGRARTQGKRRRRFPWVPALAAFTVLTACAIAYFLSGRGKYLELTETAWLLAFEGNLELVGASFRDNFRDSIEPELKPGIGLLLKRGDRVRTPDREAVAYLMSTTGVLYRYDFRGETVLARLGPGVAGPGAGKRREVLEDIARHAVDENVDGNGAAEPRLHAWAPRGNILGQKPNFEVSDSPRKESILIEIREEEPRIRLRWSGTGAKITFPSTGRPLERGRTFFWKAEGMQDEQAFFVASGWEYGEWIAFRSLLDRTGIPETVRLFLEIQYLLNRGFHLDALERIEVLCSSYPDAVWPFEEAALVLDRLGRIRLARGMLDRARRNGEASQPTRFPAAE